MMIKRRLGGAAIVVAIGVAANLANADTTKIVIGGGTGNGDFNADTSDTDARLFQETKHWHNLAGSETGPIATKHNASDAELFQGDGTRHALVLKGPVFINDTGHFVSAAGEVFQIELDFCDAIPKWNDNTDEIEVFFFTCEVLVNAHTEAKDIKEFGSIAFAKITKDGKFEAYSNLAAYTTVAGDVGKEVFVGFRAKTEAGIGRVDNFVFQIADLTRTSPTPLAGGPFGDIVKDSPGEWELVSSHSDEFDGETIDTEKWNIDPEDWGVWSWEPENVSQKDGSLHLTMVQETHTRGDKELYYKSGMAKKEESITYGYFEARVKGCSRYPGACPAFWLYSRGPENRYEAKDGEIVAYNEVDFIELQQSEYDFKRKRHYEVNHIDCNLHVVLIQNDQRIWFRPGTHPELCKTEYDAPWDPRDDYHIYAGEVTEDWIVLYIDGKEVGRKPNHYWHLPMHLALSLGLRYPFSAYTKEGLNVPVPEQTTKEGFPTTMSVDYVRVWQKRDGDAPGAVADNQSDAEDNDKSPSTVEAPVKRTWTDSTGKFTVEATLVGVKEGQVTLKRVDGSVTIVPLNRLSVDDQDVVRDLISRNDELILDE